MIYPCLLGGGDSDPGRGLVVHTKGKGHRLGLKIERPALHARVEAEGVLEVSRVSDTKCVYDNAARGHAGLLGWIPVELYAGQIPPGELKAQRRALHKIQGVEEGVVDEDSPLEALRPPLNRVLPGG